MAQGNGKDKAHEQAQLQRTLRSLPAKRRLEALLEAPNARALVHRTPAEDLYFAIAEVGLADSTELVQLASPAQFQSFVDLAAWQKDRLDEHQLLTWLRAARGDDPQEFLAKLEKLDLELVELLLRRYAVIHDLEENPDVRVEGVTLESPEGKYLVELKAEGVELFALKSLINELFGKNPLETTRLLEAIRWEVPSELEETAYRFRSARLEDLGFPSLDEALALFTYVEPEGERSRLPAPPQTTAALAPGQAPDFLEAALRQLDQDEQEALEAELRVLINSALVAEGAEPGDLAAIRAVSERARDYLLLGLEFLTHGGPAGAAEVVRRVTSRRIFQIGFSLTLRLKFRADRLVKERGGPWAAGWVFSWDAPGLSALRRKRPLKALRVEGAEPVPFRSLRELHEAEQLLERVEPQLTLILALRDQAGPAGLAWLGADPDPDRLLGAAVAQAVLEGRAAPVPLAPENAGRLLEQLFTGPPDRAEVRAETRSRALQALSAAVPPEAGGQVADVVDRTFARWSELVPAHRAGTALGPEAEELLPLARTR